MARPERSTICAGEILGDKYEVVETIGTGGMGVVWEARHIALDQQVAIKVLNQAAAGDPDLVRRFAREARAAALLTSPHVTRVTDVDVLADGTPFMVMELLTGNDLDDELEDRGQLGIREAVDYLLQACKAMAEAHGRGIVHRDLKPQNLFLTQRNNTRFVKVLDFGISKVPLEGERGDTQTASSFGTPMYMSPEQIRSTKHVDGRSDIWSLGVILYELLAGEPPFDRASPTAVIAAITADEPVPLAEIRPDVPAALSDVVMKALAKNPDDRYADVATFAEALAPYGSPDLWSLPPPPAPSSHQAARPQNTPLAHAKTLRDRSDAAVSSETLGRRRLRRRSNLVLVAGAGVLVAVALLGIWLSSTGGEVASPTAEPSGQAVVPAPQPAGSGQPLAAPPSAEPAAKASVSAAPSAPAAPSRPTLRAPPQTTAKPPQLPAKSTTPPVPKAPASNNPAYI